MAKTKESLTLNDLPSLEEQIQSLMQKREVLIKSGKSPYEVDYYFGNRSTVVKQFLFQNYELIETKDKNLLYKTFTRFLKTACLSLIPSIWLNIALGRITRGKIFEMPLILRATIRTFVFTAPPGLVLYKFNEDYPRISLYLEDKYATRIDRYMQSGDPTIINPLFEQEHPE